MPKISGWERQQSSEDDENYEDEVKVIRVWTSEKEPVEAQVRHEEGEWNFGVFNVYSEGFIHKQTFDKREEAVDHATDYLKNHTYFGVEK